MEELIISADSHVIEVPDLWEKGMPESLKERAPKVYFDEKKDAWLFGSAEVIPQAVGGLFMAGQRPAKLENFFPGGFSVGPPGGGGPLGRLAGMEKGGGSAAGSFSNLGTGFVLWG